MFFHFLTLHSAKLFAHDAFGPHVFYFLFSLAPFRLSPAVPVHEYNGLRAGTGRWQAACEQGAASAFGEDLVEVGRHSRIADVTTRRQLQQRRREGAHGGDSERWTHPAHAAAQSGGERPAARCRARWRRKEAASAPKRPPTSTPITTRRAGRALASTG